MGLYWGDQLIYEYNRFELRPAPDSPLTIDTTFIGHSPERAYEVWREQAEYWAAKLAGMVDAPQTAG